MIDKWKINADALISDPELVWKYVVQYTRNGAHEQQKVFQS